MPDPMLESFARLLVRYCVAAEPGDHVALHLETPAEELARALVREVLAAEAIPVLRLAYPEYQLDLAEAARPAFLASPPTSELEELKHLQGWIRVAAPRNTRMLQEADKATVAAMQRRLRAVTDYRIRHTRWVSSLFPTPAGAQEAGMSDRDFAAFVFGAMRLQDDDPIARWRELHAFQEELIRRLAQGRELHILAEGTDLRLGIAGRRWVNSSGRRNMPSGEVFTGPHEDSAEGTIAFTIPSRFQGTAVEGVRLTFAQGRVVEAAASVGEDLLTAQLEADPGSRYLGEVGIGTNFGITRAICNTLFDEKIGGTIHLALGSSYPETGGKNESAIHWDLVCDLRSGGTLLLDGEPLQENGSFLS